MARKVTDEFFSTPAIKVVEESFFSDEPVKKKVGGVSGDIGGTVGSSKAQSNVSIDPLANQSRIFPGLSQNPVDKKSSVSPTDFKSRNVKGRLVVNTKDVSTWVTPKPKSYNPAILPIDNNAINNYEVTQGKSVQADKNYADKDVDNQSIISLKPIISDIEDFIFPLNKANKKEEMRNLRNQKYTAREEAKIAQDAVAPELKKIVTPIGDNYNNFTKVNNNGFVIPDIDKVNEFAKQAAKSTGVSDDGHFKTLVFNEAKAIIAQKIIEPDVKKKFDALLTENGLGQGVSNKYVVEAQTIKQNAEQQVKQLSATIAEETKDKVNTIQLDLSNQVNSINSYIETETNIVSQNYGHLIKDNKFIGTEEQFAQYNNDATRIKEETEKQKLAYTDIQRKFIDQQNNIYSKANARYRRQAAEIGRIAQQELTKKEKEVQGIYNDPKTAEKVKTLYAQAYAETIKDREDYRELVSNKNNPAYNFYTNMLSALGGTIKGLSTTLNFDTGKVFGEYLQSEYQGGSAEIKKISDLLNVQKLAASSGNFVGGMLPAIVGGIATTAATRGAGATAAMQLVSNAAVAWSFDTGVQAGQIQSDIFEETGDATKAQQAAAETVKFQKAIMISYGFAGLPFMGKSIQLGKNLVTKVIAGGVVETVPEIFQEYGQNLSDEAIRKEGDYTKMFSYHSSEKLKNTALNIAPLSFVMGGAGQALGKSDATREKEAIKKAAQAFALKEKFADLAPTQREQFLFDVTQRQGLPFASAYLLSTYTSGNIDKATFESMSKTLAQSADIINKSASLELTPAQQKIFTAFTFQYDKAKVAFDEETDPLLKSAAEAKMKEYQNQVTNFVAKKQADYGVLTYPDNDQYVFTFSEIENSLNNPEFVAALKSGEIKVDMFGKGEEITKKIEALKATAVVDTKLSVPIEGKDGQGVLLPAADVPLPTEQLGKGNAIVKFQENNPEVKDLPLNTIEENLNIGDTVHGNIMGQKVSGKVTDVGVHKGQIVVDITDQNGSKRFLYSKNIERIEPKPKDVERLTTEQNKRYKELVNKEETTSDEMNELGELGKIKRGEIPNPQKELPSPTQKSGKDGVVDVDDFKVIDRPSLEKKVSNIGEAPNLEQIRNDDVAKQKKAYDDKMAIVDKVKGMSEKEYQQYYNETNPDNLPSHPLGLRNTKQATISQFEGDFKPTDYEASDAKKKHGEKILDAIGSVDNVTENLTEKKQLTPEKQTALSNQRNKLEKQLNDLGIELYTPKKNTPLEVGKVKVVDADKSGSDNVVEVVRLGLIDKKTGQVIKEAEVITGEQSLKETTKAETKPQPSNVVEGSGGVGGEVEEKAFTKNALDRADAKKIFAQVREVDTPVDAAQVH